MDRHAKELQQKSRKHQIKASANKGTFLIESSTSGTTYAVRAMTNGSFRCTCKWSEYNPTKSCSHTMAVRQWLAVAGRKALSFWASTDDAARQHRSTERISNGLWATTRRQYKQEVK